MNGSNSSGGSTPVDQPEPLGLFGQHDPAGQEDVRGPGDADEAGQEPRQAVLGREAEAPVRRGQLGTRRGEAQVAVAGQDQAHPGCRPVDGGDDRLGDAELGGEVGVELRADAVARHRHVLAEPVVVGAALDVAFERPRVRSGAEAPPRTRDHDDADPGVGGRPVEQGSVLGVHPSGPRVQAIGPVQGDGGDAGAHRVAGDLELGQLHGGRPSVQGGVARQVEGAGLGRLLECDLERVALDGALEGAGGFLACPQRHHEPVVTMARRGPPQEARLVRHQLRLHPAIQRQKGLVRHPLRQAERGDFDDRHGQAWTSMTGLPSGSVMPASVGPPGTSKGSATMLAPSVTDLSRDARRSATCT